MPDLAHTLTLKERIEATLDRGKQTVAYIAEELDESEDKVRTTLNRHRDKTFTRIGNEWGIIGYGTRSS